MPKKNDEDTPFSELSPGTQLRRAKAAKDAANVNMKAARKSGDKKKEAGATKAWSAANRVINRLGDVTPPSGDQGKEGKGSARAAPKKKKSDMTLSQVAKLAREARRNRK